MKDVMRVLLGSRIKKLNNVAENLERKKNILNNDYRNIANKNNIVQVGANTKKFKRAKRGLSNVENALKREKFKTYAARGLAASAIMTPIAFNEIDRRKQNNQ